LVGASEQAEYLKMKESKLKKLEQQVYFFP
jgi:hypothetical protein